MKKWFTFGWYKYLWSSKNWKNFWCRATQHKCGPIYYDLMGSEPDWHYKNCGEYLG